MTLQTPPDPFPLLSPLPFSPLPVEYVPLLARRQTRRTRCPFRITRQRSCSLSTCSIRGFGGKLASAMSNCVCRPKH
uniref:50S ribosomal protein L28ic n=1 Tax=Rhizophora mucronata TaxID=61149 RepID=A0A2P2Q4V7_RHIMU